MKTQVPEKVTGILKTILLLTGVWLLNSCATDNIKLALGSPWRDVAKSAQAEQSRAMFSYRMDGRKYDVVTFSRSSTGNFYGVGDSAPVVFEDGRLFAVLSGHGEWDQRFKGCVESGFLPLENGVGSLHALVMEQRRLNQRQGFSQDPDPDESIHPGHVAAAAVVVPPLLFGFGLVAVATAPAVPFAAKAARRAQLVNDALLDSGLSYANFLAKLPKPERQMSNKSYQINSYLFRFGGNTLDLYHVGFKDGKVMWVAYMSYEINARIN